MTILVFTPKKTSELEVKLSLAQCVTLYEDHFVRDMPGDLPYKRAAELVLKEVGREEFVRRLNDLDLDGTHKAQYTIYKDLDDSGESFTVYDNDLEVYVGQFLSDDPELKTYLAAGDLRDGINNQSKKGGG